MATRILKLPEVRQRVPFSRATIYLKIAKGEFPAPIRLGVRAVGWIEADIEAWIASRIEVSDGAQPTVQAILQPPRELRTGKMAARR